MNKFLVGISLVLCIVSCSKSDDSSAPNNEFLIALNNIDYESATLSWGNPFSTNTTTYTINLNGSTLESNYTSTTYVLANLEDNTSYQGEIIALNGSETLSASFSFETEEFDLLVFEGDVVLRSQQEVNDFGANGYQRIDGFIEVKGELGIITDLSSLQDLVEVEDYLFVAYTNVTSLTGLNNLKKTGTLSLWYNNELTNLDKLESLTSIEDNLILLYNDQLNNLDAVSEIANFDGVINIVGHDNLESFNIFNNNPYIEYLLIQDNINLTSVQGFQNTTAFKNINIHGNEALEFFELPSLVNVEEVLEVWDNVVLQELQFPNFNSVSQLSLNDNNELLDLDGISTITSVDYIFINSNNSLQNIDGLSNINEMMEVYLGSNDNLTSIAGLSSLVQTNTVFKIFNNDNLLSLDGLTNFTSAANLEVESNNNLTDLCGLNNLILGGGVTGSITITNNAYNPTIEDFVNGDCSL